MSHVYNPRRASEASKPWQTYQACPEQAQSATDGARRLVWAAPYKADIADIEASIEVIKVNK